MDCQSGIYRILNLINGKVYIGSALNLHIRKSKHLSGLRLGKHVNRYLQNSYNKYGEDNFKWSVLEFVPDNSIILEREQYWIDFYKSYDHKIGYNMCPKAGNTLGRKFSKKTKLKMKKSREALNLYGEKNSFYGKKHSIESRKKMSISSSGEKAPAAKLKAEQVKEIKILIMAGHSNKELCEKYHISSGIISGIKNNRKWKSVTVDGISVEDLIKKDNKSGTSNCNSKFTTDQIIEIKYLLKIGLVGNKIRTIFDVTDSFLSNLRCNRRYKNVVIPKDYIYVPRVA